MSAPDPSARQHVTAEGGFAYGVVGADLHVYVDGLPSYVLEEWLPPPESDEEWLRELPSRLLSARHEIVPFTGRTDELAELRAWRGAVGRRLAVRWLHGPGGQGKSRLAAAFARDSVAEGWKVVRAVHAPGNVLPGSAGGDLRAVGAAGVLLIVDYADHWPLPHLTWLLSNRLLHHRDLPTRVLLLARSTDQWPAVQAALHDSQAATSVQALEPLPERGGERAEMFEAARDTFAACLGAAPGAPDSTPLRMPPPVPLDGPDFGLTLAVHMAALVAVDAHLHGRRTPTDAVGLVTCSTANRPTGRGSTPRTRAARRPPRGGRTRLRRR
ncbi:ATP-binding protein [Streptomyces sp. NPDC041003]|uniref:ATP-binding protein n=1 Tax=Streptomyces sp. NPDC041003 TaxID=3155730 RepID=UPI0033F061C1